MSSFVSKSFNSSKAKRLLYSWIVFKHHKHTLNGISSFRIEQIIHYTSLGRNQHSDFINPVLGLIFTTTCYNKSSQYKESCYKFIHSYPMKFSVVYHNEYN